MNSHDLMVVAPKKAVTISDVARTLGVSKSTVSRALNDHPQMSPELRTQVLEQAREMGFRASALARNLARNRANTLGVWSGEYFNARSAYIAEIISGLQVACDENRLDLLLHGRFPGRSLDEIGEEFGSGKIDGLILLNSTPEIIEKLVKIQVPVVSLVDERSALPSVVADDGKAGELMAHFLLERGHKRILYRKRHESASANARLSGFREVLRRGGAQMFEEHIPIVGVSDNERQLIGLPLSERPTAVVGWEDDAAYEMLDFCRRAGVRVPETLAIVGLNGVDRLGSGPRLTTVVMPYDYIAQKGVELLLCQLRGESVPRLTTLPVALRLGETA